MNTVKASPGDVIQIDPEYTSAFGGCFAFVEEVKDWGVSLCGVPIPGEDNPIAYYRIPHGKYAIVGRAEWMPGEQ